MLIDEQFRVVDILNVLEWYWAESASSTYIVQTVYFPHSPFSWTTKRVTRTAVSVVICLGPNRRPTYPFFLNSEVRSTKSSVSRRSAWRKKYIPLGGSSPADAVNSQRVSLNSICTYRGVREKFHTEDTTEQEDLKGITILRTQLGLSGGV